MNELKVQQVKLETLKDVRTHMEQGELTLDSLNHWIASQENLIAVVETLPSLSDSEGSEVAVNPGASHE